MDTEPGEVGLDQLTATCVDLAREQALSSFQDDDPQAQLLEGVRPFQSQQAAARDDCNLASGLLDVTTDRNRVGGGPPSCGVL